MNLDRASASLALLKRKQATKTNQWSVTRWHEGRVMHKACGPSAARHLYKGGVWYGVMSGMHESTEKLIVNALNRHDDLEECLAGFIMVAGINGAYLPEDVKEWAKKKLEGKQRTPAQVWNDLNREETESTHE